MREIRSEAVHHGRNIDLNAGRQDDRYVRCTKCNFIAHLDRDRRAPCDSRVGDGIKYVDLSVLYNSSSTLYDACETTYDGLTGVKDPVVVMGCPLCGSLLYDKEEC
jgi:ssDNA-binding Zn-finger/Zn-ribbon topoisomerase 1